MNVSQYFHHLAQVQDDLYCLVLSVGRLRVALQQVFSQYWAQYLLQMGLQSVTSFIRDVVQSLQRHDPSYPRR